MSSLDKIDSTTLRTRDLKEILKQYVIWLILAILFIVSTILSRGVFFTAENLLHLLRQVSMVAIVTTGQIFVMLGIDDFRFGQRDLQVRRFIFFVAQQFDARCGRCLAALARSA